MRVSKPQNHLEEVNLRLMVDPLEYHDRYFLNQRLFLTVLWGKVGAAWEGRKSISRRQKTKRCGHLPMRNCLL